MFKERNQGCGTGNDLGRSHVHILDAVRARQHEFAVVASGNQFLRQTTFIIHLGIGLSNDVAAFFNRRQIGNLLRRDAVDHLAVRRFQEPVFVEAGVKGKRVDQTDVRTFRRFNRAHTAVVRRMHVAHFKAGAFAGQTARTESGNTALMGNFRQRVGLVHELRKLARTEEFADGGADRLGIDQILRRKTVAFRLIQTLLDGAFNAHQAGAELIFREFADAADTTVAEVVNVVHAVDRAGTHNTVGINQIDIVLTVAQSHEHGHRVDDVFLRQRHRARCTFTAEAGIDLHAADTRQIVGFGIEEEAIEERFNRFFRRRFAGTHHAVDRNAGSQLIRRVVQTQSRGNVRAVIQLIRKERFNLGHAGKTELRQKIGRHFIVAIGNDFTRFFIDDVLGKHAAEHIFIGNVDRRHAGLRQITDMLGSNALVCGDEFLAVMNDRETDSLPLQTIGNEGQRGALRLDRNAVEAEEARKNVFRRKAEGLKQNRTGHLAAAVNAEIKTILGVKLEVEPRTAVGNHAGREEQLAGRVRLSLVVFEENAGRTVQLADNHSFRTVDDERALFRHQGNLTHVDVVLADFLNRFRLGSVAVENLKLNLGTQAAAIRQAAQLAFFHVEFRLSEFVIDEAKTSVTVVAGNRENGSKSRLQTVFGFAVFGGDIRLQKFFVGTKLSIKQGGHFKDARARGKALADALLFSERVRHGHSVRH